MEALMLKARLALALLAFSMLGCAGATAQGGAGRSDIIVAEQLRARSFPSVYDAVETLRSNWLRTRGQDSFSTPTEIQVYMDNVRMGGVATLRSISPSTVTYIQWYNANDATARWGIGHGAGAIYVSTRAIQ
jgi:hypothetical protein